MYLSGIGIHSFWGTSPSNNLLNCFPINEDPNCQNEPINILLLQTSDPRHLINTIAHRHRTCQRPIHFYIFEQQSELFARHLLLLHIFFDKLPIRQRASIFLEVFGNSLVQKRTELYIEEVGSKLRELVYEGLYNGPLAEMMDFSHMNQKVKDGIAEILKMWKIDTDFDVIGLRDQRLRACYGERYDCRKSIVDWDYYSRVKKVASIIHIKQWRHWRMTGIAFEFCDVTYTQPNRSTATFVEGTSTKGRHQGRKDNIKGYFLDILIGPYTAFGVQCQGNHDDKNELMNVVNKGTGVEQHQHNTVDLALFNIISWMWEFEVGDTYKMKIKGDIYSGLGKPKMDIKSTNKYVNPDDHAFSQKEDIKISTKSCLNNKNFRAEKRIRIIPLCGNLNTILSKKKYRNLFDFILFSQQTVNCLSNEIFHKILKSNKAGTVAVETGKYIFPLTTIVQQEKVIDKILGMAQQNNFNLIKKRMDQNSEQKCLTELDTLYFSIA